jgi:hypothetical protein
MKREGLQVITLGVGGAYIRSGWSNSLHACWDSICYNWGPVLIGWSLSMEIIVCWASGLHMVAYNGINIISL